MHYLIASFIVFNQAVETLLFAANKQLKVLSPKKALVLSMFTTITPKLQTQSPLQSYAAESQSTSRIVQPDDKCVEVEIDDWDQHLKTIHEAMSEAEAAEKKAQGEYNKVQALAVAWQRQMQLALSSCDEVMAHRALAYRRSCMERAQELKALAQQHSIQVHMLRTQLAFWQPQLSA